MKLSIVIPAHNEEHRLPPVLKQYVKFFSHSLGEDFEIIVVVNGSTDRTADVVQEIAQQHPQIQLIEETGRIGKGGAIILGVKAAQGEWIGFVDADGATTPKEFFRLYKKANGSDGVIASRWMKGAKVSIPQRGLRLISSRLFNGLTRVLLGLKFRDTQCGAKIFTAKAWKTILPAIGTTRFAFDVDLLFQLKRHGFQVLEEPTVWNDVEGSKVQLFNTSLEMFLAVIRMRLLYSPFKFVVRWYDRLLARPVDFLLSDQLFRHAALLFSASLFSLAGNIGFQMITGHMLPEEEYALMATFLALFTVMGRPVGTLSIAMSHYVAILKEKGRNYCISRLLLKWVLLTGGFSLAVTSVTIFFAPQIAAFFHLGRVAPVIVSALALPTVFIGPVLLGALRGEQRFFWVSLSQIGLSLGRLLFAFLFLSFVVRACGWALAGHVAGMYLSLTIAIIAFIPFLHRSKGESLQLPSLRFYLAQCVVVQFSVAVLCTADVILVKHYLPETTGFAYAATLGRMVTLIAAAVAGSMGPKVASAGKFNKKHRNLYLRSMLYASAATMISLVVCLAIPSLLIRILFGSSALSPEVITLTRGMALAMAPAILLGINTSFLLAQRRFRELIVVVFCALLYLFSAMHWHTNAMQVVWFAGIANLIGFIITTTSILKTTTKNSPDLREEIVNG